MERRVGLAEAPLSSTFLQDSAVMANWAGPLLGLDRIQLIDDSPYSTRVPWPQASARRYMPGACQALQQSVFKNTKDGGSERGWAGEWECRRCQRERSAARTGGTGDDLGKQGGDVADKPKPDGRGAGLCGS